MIFSKFLIAAVALVCSVSASEMQFSVDLDNAEVFNADTRYIAWKKRHAKQYLSEEAENKARAMWSENDAFIQEHNAKGLSYTVGHNQYSDLSWYQFSKLYVGGYESNPHLRRQKNYNHSLSSSLSPESVDWTAKGAVTPVKNQGQCGSCWAFSTTGSLEGAYQIASGKLVSLSEQDLVSCDKVDSGCQGGLMDNAFKFIKKNGGICSESEYPYSSGTGSAGTCKKHCKKKVTLDGFVDVPSKDENALAAAVAKQPVSVAIEADKQAFQLYRSGVFSSKTCGTQLDHGVLAVGYGALDGKKYWKVKNSWGSSWGDNGYILIQRGTNECGISQQPSYPTGAHAVKSFLE